MKSIKSRGGAVLAAVATAAALAVPLVVGAQAASAAEPTAISVDHATNYAAISGSASYTVTLSGGTPTHSVFVAVTGGTDANGLVGSLCAPAGGQSYTCTVTNGGSPTTDTLNFFYDAASTGTYQNGDPTTAGSLVIGGAVNSVAITPTTDRTAQGVFRGFTVSATDDHGRAITGADLSVKATEANATNANVKNVVAVTAPAPVGPTDPSSGSTGSQTVTATTATASANSPTATTWITSRVSGTVNILVSSGAAASQSATLTVDPGTANDITTVTPSSPTLTSYVGKTVSTNVTLTNTQGDPVAGVTPAAAVTGTDAGAATTVAPASGAAAGPGVYTVTYTAGGAAGSDTLTVWVNKTTPGHTNSKDADEAFGTVTVTVQAENIGAITSAPVTVPAGTMNASVVFNVKTSTPPVTNAAGIGLTFSVPAGYTVTPSGTTDADGNATATVTAADAAHAVDGSSVIVTATVTQDNAKFGTSTVHWVSPSSVTNVTITPVLRTSAVGGTVSFTASATDAFGNPVTGLTYTWGVVGPRNDPSNNPGATGAGTTFSYTDMGQATTGGADFVTVTATSPTDPGIFGANFAEQIWVLGSAQVDQLGISDFGQGGFVQNSPPSGPYIPTGFVNSDNSGPTADPSASGSAFATPITVKVIDANGNPLYGKVISFASTGVGGFTDSTGHPLATPGSTTALVDFSGEASVFVRSTHSGVQTITATADGKTGTFTMTYQGAYVPTTPTRLIDTRTGQGGLTSAPGVPLPANTLTAFNPVNAGAPDAGAYALNVTAISASHFGNLRIGSRCGGVPTTSLVNYQAGKTVANFVIVPAGCNGLKFYSDGTAIQVAVDLLGYYPTASSSPASDTITKITPARVVNKTTIAGGTTQTFQIAGQGGIDTTAKAVALNITAVHPTGVGNLRVYPDGSSKPNSSVVNYIKGVDKAAFVIVNLPANGKIDVFSDGGSAGVIVDAFAYYGANVTGLVTQAPQRIDAGTLAANHVANVPVAGQAGVPADAQAVLVTVTSVHKSTSTGTGNLRVFPTGGSLPTVSTLNYVGKSADVANFAIVPIGADGQISLYSDGSPIGVLLDVVGWVPAGV